MTREPGGTWRGSHAAGHTLSISVPALAQERAGRSTVSPHSTQGDPGAPGLTAGTDLAAGPCSVHAADPSALVPRNHSLLWVPQSEGVGTTQTLAPERTFPHLGEVEGSWYQSLVPSRGAKVALPGEGGRGGCPDVSGQGRAASEGPSLTALPPTAPGSKSGAPREWGAGLGTSFPRSLSPARALVAVRTWTMA